MVKRSLRVSLSGIQQAKRAFALKGWTQENLTGEVNLKTRQPIWRFFAGMDEVLNQDVTAVLREICKFSNQYHRNRITEIDLLYPPHRRPTTTDARI